MDMTPDETAWHDHDEHPGAGRDGWRFTSAERRALLALVKAAGPVRVMDVTTEAAAVRQAITQATAARRADESAARLARYARGDVGYRLLG